MKPPPSAARAPIPPGQIPRTTAGGPSSGTSSGQQQMAGDSRILSKQKLQDLVAQVDPSQRLDTDAEDVRYQATSLVHLCS